MLILAPIAAMLIQMAISRTREYAADETSAHVTHNPDELISALGKLETYSKRIPMQDVNPATAHLFIIKPFSGQSMMRPVFDASGDCGSHRTARGHAARRLVRYREVRSGGCCNAVDG